MIGHKRIHASLGLVGLVFLSTAVSLAEPHGGGKSESSPVLPPHPIKNVCKKYENATCNLLYSPVKCSVKGKPAYQGVYGTNPCEAKLTIQLAACKKGIPVKKIEAFVYQCKPAPNQLGIDWL